MIRNIEPHIDETPAYASGLQQYPVTNGSSSHITALSTIVDVQLNLVTTGAELETHRMGCYTEVHRNCREYNVHSNISSLSEWTLNVPP